MDEFAPGDSYPVVTDFEYYSMRNTRRDRVGGVEDDMQILVGARVLDRIVTGFRVVRVSREAVRRHLVEQFPRVTELAVYRGAQATQDAAGTEGETRGGQRPAGPARR